MEIVVKSLILSIMLGISCKEYFEIFLQRRWKSKIINYTLILAFTISFMIISLSPIPPYLWQPVRLIVMVWMVVQIYYKVRILQNIVLTLFLSGIICILSELVNGILALLPVSYEFITFMGDPIWCSLLLCLILMFSYYHKGCFHLPTGIRWLYFGFFPILSICVSMALSIVNWQGEIAGESISSVILVGISITNILAFYFIGNIILKEAEMQDMRILYEHTQNQMKIYQDMEQNYQSQKRLMHDYKNQLSTVQGLLVKNQTKEALDYIEKLTGTVQKNINYIDTNHSIVNVVLNQKYQYALRKGITMTIAVNDLSALKMSEEDTVILLVNLIDNAIEACEKVESGRIIRFKMLIEDDELILSVSNPVKEPIAIKDKRVLSTKQDDRNHGIGLLNVDSAINRNGGTSVLKCADGWFCFSAMIPVK